MNDQLALFSERATLEDAKVRLWDGVKDGINCPCCNRWAQAYWRTINKTMARGLWWLYQQGLSAGRPDHPVHYTDITKGPAWLLRSNQLATLRWWGLVEKKPNDDPAKKSSGMWRVTPLGIRLLHGVASVPRRVCTLFGDVVAVSEDQLFIEDIGHYFNYAETMGNTSDR